MGARNSFSFSYLGNCKARRVRQFLSPPLGKVNRVLASRTFGLAIILRPCDSFKIACRELEGFHGESFPAPAASGQSNNAIQFKVSSTYDTAHSANIRGIFEVNLNKARVRVILQAAQVAVDAVILKRIACIKQQVDDITYRD